MTTLPVGTAATSRPQDLRNDASRMHALRAAMAGLTRTALLVASILLAGCSLPSATSGTTSTTTVPCAGGVEAAAAAVCGDPEPPPPGTVALGICADASGSMPPDVLAGAVTTMSDAVAAWPGTPPADPEEGADGRLGLDLTARRITASSFTSTGLVLRAHIPPVPSVSPRPAVSDPDFVELNRRWRDQRDAAASGLTTAQNAAAGASNSLRSASFESDGSRISGCVAALAQSLPAASRRAVFVISDLMETGADQIAGDLQGAPVMVVQPCEDPVPCQERADRFGQALAAMGAGPVTFIRPEALPDHLHGILGDPVAH